MCVCACVRALCPRQQQGDAGLQGPSQLHGLTLSWHVPLGIAGNE